MNIDNTKTKSGSRRNAAGNGLSAQSLKIRPPHGDVHRCSAITYMRDVAPDRTFPKVTTLHTCPATTRRLRESVLVVVVA
jgi:hypothetical protein